MYNLNILKNVIVVLLSLKKLLVYNCVAYFTLDIFFLLNLEKNDFKSIYFMNKKKITVLKFKKHISVFINVNYFFLNFFLFHPYY